VSITDHPTKVAQEALRLDALGMVLSSREGPTEVLVFHLGRSGLVPDNNFTSRNH